MATINKAFPTKRTPQELKNDIDELLVKHPDLAAFVGTASWHGSTLKVESKLGVGMITLLPGQIVVDINLTLFGSAAKSTIEKRLSEGMKLLEPPRDKEHKNAE